VVSRDVWFQAGDEVDPFHEAIGRVIVADAQLEGVMGELYAAMIGSELGYFVAAGLGFDQLYQACQKLQVVGEASWHPLHKHFEDVLKRAKALHEERNKVAHAGWFSDPSLPDRRVTYRPRRWRPSSLEAPRDWSVEQLRVLANDIGVATRDVFFLTTPQPA
jgi:hypothetical protein